MILRCFLVFLGYSLLYSCDTADFDIYIKNAEILDGSGDPAFTSNLGIKDNQITYLSSKDLKVAKQVEVIDAKGKTLAPGFIDLHAHANPERTPQFENFLAMGVTSICLGQDGSSPYQKDLGAYLDSLKTKSFGTNVMMFTGHGTLRNLSGIGTSKNPSPKDLEALSELLEDQLQYCFGLSTGLEYSPGLNANAEELATLAKIVGKYDRIIMSHMRNEDDDQLFKSIEELADQGKYSKVHIAHLKSVYGKGKERGEEILAFIKSLREGGIEITADIYPYTASYTGISILFPIWSKTKKQFDAVKVERRKELEDYLKRKVESRNGPEATLLGTAPYVGKTLADLENEWGISYVDILIDSIGPQGASAAYFVMDEDLQETLIANPLLSICSDGSPTGNHPRGHGTFARIIEEFVFNREVLTLEEAIRKMTSYPAEILGIEDRGMIQLGMKADLVLFDPQEVQEKANYQNPHQFAEGFDLVIVNGKIARRQGNLIEGKAGNLLFPSQN